MRKQFYIVALLAIVLWACGCEKKPQEPQPSEEADLSLITQSVPVTDNWIWSGKPQITLHIENPNKAAVKVPIVVKISTDKKVAVTEIQDSVEIAGEGTRDFVVTTTENLDPGFYRAVCFVNSKSARSFIFGIDPFQIVSAPDYQSDFVDFWQSATDQLAAVDMKAKLTEITERSSDSRKVYLVEMMSVPDGLTGEPVLIRGYYCEPQDGQKHPVIFHFYGYDTQGSKSKCECPYGGNSAQFAEFYLSHRGQYLNNRPASTKNLGIDEDCASQAFLPAYAAHCSYT